MALVGRLEDLQLTELFHVLSLFRKSGKLTLSHGDDIGTVVFNNGKILHASNGRSRPFLGNVLLEKGLVTQKTLDQALAVQKTGAEWSKIGTVLVDMGAVTQEGLERVVRAQLQEITEQFLQWESGFFSFKPLATRPQTNEQSFDGGTELDEGINTDQFLLELMTRVDEVGRTRDAKPKASTETPPSDSSGQTVRKMADFVVDPGSDVYEIDSDDSVHEWPDDLAELRALMTEIQRWPASFTAEIALMILRYATRVVNRGVLFGVSPEGISGIGQFGVGDENDDPRLVDKRIRQIVIPKNEPSVFFDVIKQVGTFHGPLEQSRWNSHVIDQLGGIVPPAVVAIPIAVDGRILAIFYGDNLPGGHPITSIHGLELLMIEAGLAIEKNLLHERLKSVEARMRAMTGELGSTA